MSEFEVRPISELPPRRGRALAQAIRELRPGEALFVAAREGEDLSIQANRINGTVLRLGAHIRSDRKKNGVWVYKEVAS